VSKPYTELMVALKQQAAGVGSDAKAEADRVTALLNAAMRPPA
jgi:hypothetical protein